MKPKHRKLSRIGKVFKSKPKDGKARIKALLDSLFDELESQGIKAKRSETSCGYISVFMHKSDYWVCTNGNKDVVIELDESQKYVSHGEI